MYQAIAWPAIALGLVISFIMVVIGLTHQFKDERYNRLAIYFGVINAFIMLSAVIRNILRSDAPVDLASVPDGIRCAFGDVNLNGGTSCTGGNISLWSIFHVIIFGIAGWYIPGLYFEILVLSIFYELFEGVIGYQAKLLVDPIINVTSYTIGSLLSPYRR